MYNNGTLIHIKKNINGFLLTQTKIKFKGTYRRKVFNDKKFDSAIYRAKSILYDLVKNNDFDFFVTLTLNNKHSNLDLKQLILNINNRVKYMRKKGFNDLRYILIPEKTKKRNFTPSRFF